MNDEYKLDWRLLSLILRFVSIILGTIIFWQYSLVVEGHVSFWYYTIYTPINRIVAMLIVFVVGGIILYPIYPPKNLRRVLQGYLGIALFSIGNGISVRIGYALPDLEMVIVGYIMILIGLTITSLAYRNRKSIDLQNK